MLHMVPDVWDMLLEHGLQFVQRCRTCNLVKEGDPICAWTNGIAQHHPQAVELNTSCLGQAHPNKSGTSPEYKNMEPGSIFTILHIPLMVCPLKSVDAKSGKVV